jgi:transitional endoplasmic reticulum ATPase
MKYFFIYLGRLDQLIHIPLPDDESRMAILEVSLGKSFAVKDVDMNYLVNETLGFSGADLTNICQRACILATREFMEKGQQPIWPITMNSDESPVIEIRREHLEKAMKFACPSINNNHITKYERLAQQFKESNGLGTQFPSSQSDLWDQSEPTQTENVTI